MFRPNPYHWFHDNSVDQVVVIEYTIDQADFISAGLIL